MMDHGQVHQLNNLNIDGNDLLLAESFHIIHLDGDGPTVQPVGYLQSMGRNGQELLRTAGMSA